MEIYNNFRYYTFNGFSIQNHISLVSRKIQVHTFNGFLEVFSWNSYMEIYNNGFRYYTLLFLDSYASTCFLSGHLDPCCWGSTLYLCIYLYIHISTYSIKMTAVSNWWSLNTLPIFCLISMYLLNKNRCVSTEQLSIFNLPPNKLDFDRHWQDNR